MHSNSYTFIYAAVMTVITGILLALASEGLRPAQEANIALEKKKNILNSVRLRFEKRSEIEAEYNQKIKEMVIDQDGNEITGKNAFDIALKETFLGAGEEKHLPLYIFSGDDGKKYYIIPMFGNGLWGPIWGYISIDGSDMNTIFGAFFDHKGETPGLGAEIASYEKFQQQFEGKKIRDSNAGFVSVRVVKMGVKTDFASENKVDGISGGTITSNATDKMMYNCMKRYLKYFERLRQQ